MALRTPVAEHAPAQSNYRTDLDGLRGIAIALVVIFHVFVGRVSGGVDVFLLLSGYFFLGSQLRYVTRPRANLNPWWPLWRTIRRLVPVLAVTLAATALAVFFITPQLISPELAHQFPAAVGYFLNWELISQNADYAAASVDTSPLQHLWSMAVQGQFYLGAILFAVFLGFFARRQGWDQQRLTTIAGPILIAVTVISFFWASRQGIIGTPENYYSTFSRTWELTLGAVFGLYRDKLRFSAEFSRIVVPAGLIAVCLTGFIVPTSLAFPGPAALIPIGGASLIILSDGRSKTAQFMSSPFASWLGRIAYSLYLWHWPMLIIVTSATNQDAPNAVTGVVVILASLILADLSYRFIESPLRQHASRPMLDEDPVTRARHTLEHPAGRARAVGGVIVAVMLLGLLSIKPVYAHIAHRADTMQLDDARYPGVYALFGAEVPDAPLQPSPKIIAGIYPPPGNEGCVTFSDQPADFIATTSVNGEPCLYGDTEADVDVVIAGGSHAETWIISLDILGKQHGFRVVPFLRQACPIVLVENYGVSRECAQWSEMVVDRIIDLDPAFVLSSSTRPATESGFGQDRVAPGYENYWAALDKAGIPFVGMRDNPWMTDEDGEPFDPNYCIIDNDGEPCETSRRLTYAEINPADAILAQYKNAISVDTADWFCGEEACPAVIGNIPVYRDQNHISNAYAETLTSLLWREIRSLL